MMNDIKNYHRRFIAEFIELYKAYPTLWDLKSPEYTDRESKREAYVKLVKKLREIEPECTKQDVIKKINSLRSAFRREYKKVKSLTACGKLYRPTLWYYDLISFTVNGGNRQRLKQDIIAEPSNQSLVDPLNATLVKQESEYESPVEDYADFGSEENILIDTDSPTLNMNCLNPAQDEFDAVGYNVASKLRNMKRDQRIIAERIIAETLFQGQMETLRVSTSPPDLMPTLLQNAKGSSSPTPP